MTDRAYLRVSVVRTAPGQKATSSGTIKKQRAQLRAHLAADHELYVDENVSASKILFGYLRVSTAEQANADGLTPPKSAEWTWKHVQRLLDSIRREQEIA